VVCDGSQVLDLSQTPDLETPRYTVLRAARDYEIRRYEPFVVAEAPMGAGSSEGVDRELLTLSCCPETFTHIGHVPAFMKNLVLCVRHH
jgi:hypothetical protein